jgi:hypothetical protein
LDRLHWFETLAYKILLVQVDKQSWP